MKKKILMTILAGTMAFGLVACGEKNVEPKEDVVAAASAVTDESTLLNALDNSWIVTVKSDLKTDKDIVINKDFEVPDKEDPSKMVLKGRKLALIEKDDKQVVTASHTINAPKLVIKSQKTTLLGGKFVGDIYVESNDFTIQDTEVEGDIYFANAEVEKSFKLEGKASVSGNQIIKK